MRNTRTIRLEAEAATISMSVETAASDANPRTGKLAPLSVLACLRGLSNTPKTGS